jgi:hypothetical protein
LLDINLKRLQLPARFKEATAGQRSRSTRKSYCILLDSLIQAVISAKKFKDNRLTKPLTEWVTISDEAFMMLCIDNYHRVWIYDKTQGATLEEGSERPSSLFTGRDKGTRKSWSKRAINIFNMKMEDVYHDRKRHGKNFDEYFLKKMKEKYGKKSKAAAALRPGSSEHETAQHEQEQKIVLSDFNIEYVMEQRRKIREQEQKQGNDEEQEGDDDKVDDEDDSDDESDDGSSAGPDDAIVVEL